MCAKNHIAKLKARIDQAITQRDHWRQVAYSRHYIEVTRVDPDSKQEFVYRVTPADVQDMWKRIDEMGKTIDALTGAKS